MRAPAPLGATPPARNITLSGIYGGRVGAQAGAPLSPPPAFGLAQIRYGVLQKVLAVLEAP